MVTLNHDQSSGASYENILKISISYIALIPLILTVTREVTTNELYSQLSNIRVMGCHSGVFKGRKGGRGPWVQIPATSSGIKKIKK